MPRDLFATTLLAAAFFLMAAVPGAEAQNDGEDGRRLPPGASSAPSIVLYAETNLRGPSVELTGDLTNFSTLRFNDTARSAEVRGGVWLLCSNANFGGTCEYVDRTVPNLGDIGLSRAISSVKVTPYDKGPRSYDIAFFADADFRGPFLGFDHGEAELSSFRFNDTASSVVITRGDWLVCEHADYRGNCELIEDSMTDLGAINLNDRISSFRRYDTRREGPWRRPIADPGYPWGGRASGGVRGEQTMFFPSPTDRGQRIRNRDGAATRFCQEEGFEEAVYKSPGPYLSDVLCR